MSANGRFALALAGFLVVGSLAVVVFTTVLGHQYSPEEPPTPIAPATVTAEQLKKVSEELENMQPLPQQEDFGRRLHADNIRKIRQFFPHLDPKIEEEAETELEIQQISKAYIDILEGRR
jgi:hypothetical protein